eukprot:TRINITY_DN1015_c1_g1_i1.p1 TRINITY_DN1015_c1_g1~~TRINITY_DN1015_c1_g1_i1.p1  ORF type:complete len:431 (+),score=203.16 TRINITY_DN1015_c1_g1_i1:85-1293(+)
MVLHNFLKLFIASSIVLLACFMGAKSVQSTGNRFSINAQTSPLPTPIPVTPYSVPLPFFGCQPYTILKDEFSPPTNVNQLRPHDIKALMSLGDSITAGFGMHSKHLTQSVTDLVEYRGDSFSIGGNAMQYALGNYFSVFNPDLVGPSVGYSEPISALEWHGSHLFPFNKDHSRLNAAQSGGKVEDLIDQVNYLINELKTTYATKIDYNNDWKMATILIGANNMCVACHNGTNSTPEYFRQNLNATIAKMYAEIPRLWVNVLPMFNISQVYDWVQTSSYCKDMWRTLSSGECPCQTGKATLQDRLLMDKAAQEYREVVWDLYYEWNAKNLTSFKFAVQPFTSRLEIIDLAFLSEFDCFHPSWYAHAAMSIGLWNNLMTPMNQKAFNITVGIEFKCPDKHTFLQ